MIQDEIYARATQKARQRLRADLLTALSGAATVTQLLIRLCDEWMGRMGPKAVGIRIMEVSNLLDDFRREDTVDKPKLYM
ncbi:hypothetical protein ADUPG1_011140 [Aduncisulcus paluster]|uniref:Uncharacterized protein n=1 Tax=Aduncisulcus paluster TaxID=2918883 RepID=A0ABQ5JUH5_9EUKA|nr:hypothetical protein ADUPG1_011140 [Aduncisulcus paluster]